MYNTSFAANEKRNQEQQEELAYFISVLDCVYSNHITDGIKVESRIIRYSQRGLLEKIQLH